VTRPYATSGNEEISSLRRLSSSTLCDCGFQDVFLVAAPFICWRCDLYLFTDLGAREASPTQRRIKTSPENSTQSPSILNAFYRRSIVCSPIKPVEADLISYFNCKVFRISFVRPSATSDCSGFSFLASLGNATA
jgi:hypothetical protein